MNGTAAPAQALDTAPAMVQRYAVILRHNDGKAELLHQLHTTQKEAAATGRFWQGYFQGPPVKAEVVTITIPTAGNPVADAKDLFSGVKADER